MVLTNKRLRWLISSVAILSLCIIFSYILLPGLWEKRLPFLREETPASVSFEFARALRLNDDRAYELTTTSSRQRLDTWMASHEVYTCERVPEQFSSGGNLEERDSYFYCFLDDGRKYDFNVTGIKVRNIDGKLTVTGWDEPIELFDDY